MNYSEIIQRPDGSFVINNGMYHVPNNEEFAEQYLDVVAYAAANPKMVTPEIIQQYEPTPEELATQRLAAIDAELQSLEQQASRPIGPVTLAMIKGEAADSFDVEKLAAIEARKVSLREERASLTG